MNFIVPMARFPDQSESTKVASFTSRQGDVSPVEFQALPGPEVRALRAKIMRHVSFLGSGGPSGLRIVDCGMRIEKKLKKSEIRNSKSEMEGPMLFPRNALPSGPQAFLFTKKNKSEGGRSTKKLTPFKPYAIPIKKSGRRFSRIIADRYLSNHEPHLFLALCLHPENLRSASLIEKK